MIRLNTEAQTSQWVNAGVLATPMSGRFSHAIERYSNFSSAMCRRSQLKFSSPRISALSAPRISALLSAPRIPALCACAGLKNVAPQLMPLWQRVVLDSSHGVDDRMKGNVKMRRRLFQERALL